MLPMPPMRISGSGLVEEGFDAWTVAKVTGIVRSDLNVRTAAALSGAYSCTGNCRLEETVHGREWHQGMSGLPGV